MTPNRLSLPAPIIKAYSLKAMQGMLPPIQVSLAEVYNRPFPKSQERLKSFYKYRQRRLRRDKRGQICGGAVRLVSILFDFSYTRAIFAEVYATRGGHCYDPVSLFVLLLCAYLDGYEYTSDFVDDLHDPDRGRQYRVLAGIKDNIPQEADFSNFLSRCGGQFDQVMALVVEILQQAGFISGRMQTTDGTLVPTFARYRGCNYCQTPVCANWTLPSEAVAALVAQKVSELASQLSANNPVCGGHVQSDCPFWGTLCNGHAHLKKKKRPHQARLLHLRLHYLRRGCRRPEGEDGREQLSALGLTVTLDKQIFLEVVSCNLQPHEAGLLVHCSRLSSDPQARLGVHISPKTGKQEYVFGRDVLITSNVELCLGNLTLPIAVSVHPANIWEGTFFPEHHQQTDVFAFEERCHILDAGYDSQDVNEHLRQRDCRPIIAYNPRREDLSPDALAQRGYDQQGWPLADCGRPMPPLAPLADEAGHVHHACWQQCLLDSPTPDEESCPFLQERRGQTRQMAIADHPRLVAEVVRSTPERQKVQGLRSPSESVNSYAQTCTGLKAPRCRGDAAFFARAHLSVLTALLRKVVHFILDLTQLTARLPRRAVYVVPPPPRSRRQQTLDTWLWQLVYDDG